MSLIDSWIALKTGFSFETVLICTKLYKHLEPLLDQYLDENGFILGRHLKCVSKKVIIENNTIFINTVKADQKFNDFKNSLKPIINNFANSNGYKEIDSDKSFSYIFFNIFNMYTSLADKTRIVSKAEFCKIIGYDIYTDLGNNAHVYLSKNFEAWSRKEKIKKLLS